MARRLIDANAIHGECNSDNPEFIAGWNALAVEIDQAPAIDAVEVVRCRECKHRKDTFVCPMCGESVAPEGEDWGVCDWAEDDGFCHKGERREPDGK